MKEQLKVMANWFWHYKKLLGIGGILSVGLMIYGNNCGGGGGGGSDPSMSPGASSVTPEVVDAGGLGPSSGGGVVPSGPAITLLALGGAHGCVVVGDGIQCWGSNTYGQLGDGTVVSRSQPAWVLTAPGGARLRGAITGLAAGQKHTCAIVDGAVMCWGLANDDLLGISSLSASLSVCHSGSAVCAFNPRLVPGLSSGVIAMALGRNSSCFLISGGVQCAGLRSQIGRGTSLSSALLDWVAGLGPSSSDPVTALSSGGTHYCALKGAQVYCWGYNYYGNLGAGTPGIDAEWGGYDLTPQRVLLPSISGTLDQVVTNLKLSCVSVRPSGTGSAGSSLYCWGDLFDVFGPVAPGITATGARQFTPLLVTGIVPSSGATLSMGARTFCALSGGTLQCVGYGKNLFLDGCDETHLSSCPCSAGAGVCTITSATGVGFRTSFTTLSGLGASPVSLASFSKFPAIPSLDSGGPIFGCAVQSSRTLKCWGQDAVNTIADYGVPSPTGTGIKTFPFGSDPSSADGVLYSSAVTLTLAP